MHIATLIFVLFVVITAAVYHLIGRRFKKYWLLGASYYFYDTWSTKFLITVVIFTLTNYMIARILGRAERDRRLILILGIGFNIVYLFLLKYADFFLPAFNELLARIGLSTPALSLLFPIGLSYMVLQAIGYLIDVYRREMEPETDLAYFAIFISYFPKVLSGPIESARRFIPPIREHKPLTAEHIGRGLFLFLEGLFRKRVLADLMWALDPYGNIFADLSAGKLTILLWVLGAIWALYMDFSGYSNMARGISYFFGIELSLNFRAPLLASTMTDHWSRWHISFTNWLREYIFYPLSRVLIRRARSTRSVLSFAVPIAASMAVSALWHSIAPEHALWAGYIGVVLILEQHYRMTHPAHAQAKKRFWQHIPVFLLLIPINSLFMNSLRDTLSLWRAFAFTTPLTFDPEALRALWLIVPSMLIEWAHFRTDDEFWVLHMKRVGPLIAATALIILFVVSYTDLLEATFVYQDF